MKFFKSSSIRTKLKLAILSTTFLAVVLVFAGFSAYEQIRYNDILVKDLSTKADIIAENSDAALAFGISTDATRVLKSLTTQPHIMSAAIYDEEGAIFATYLREEGAGSIPLAPISEGSWFETDALILSQPIKRNSAQIGTIYLKMDLLGRQEHFRSYIEIALLVLLGSLAAAFVVATILEKNISKPILGLARTTQKVSEQRDYSIRAEKVSGDETGLLADAVNQMLAQIQERDENLRRINQAMGEEIAERVRVEQALRGVEAQLRLITDTTPLMLTRCNREKQYVYVNRAYAEMVKLVPEKIVGKSVGDIMGEEGYKSTSAYMDNVLQGLPVEFEAEIPFPHIGLRFLRVAYMPDKNDQGDVVGWFESMSDITKSKLADQALRTSEERFRQFMTNLPGAAWIKDWDGRYVYANEESCRIFGYSRSELYGKTDEEIFPQETAHQFRKNDQKAKESGAGIQSMESLLVDGSVRFSIVTKFPVLGHEGTPMFIGGIAIDITERKQAEEALHESEERSLLAYAKLAAIVESSSDAIVSLDLEGIITSWNAGAERAFGYKAEDIIGKPVFDIVPMDFHITEREMLERLRHGERIEPFDTIRTRKGGQPVYVSLSISAVKDSSGRIIGSSKIARDITELRKAHDELEIRVRERTADLVRVNEELRKRDLQLSTAQQIANMGSWEWDLQTSVVTWSEELYRIYGLHRGEFAGTLESFLNLLHPEDRSATIDHIQESIRSHEPFDFEERIIRPDGDIRILHSQGRVVKDANENVVKLLGVCLDVTDRQRAQEKFRGLLESAPDAMIIAQQDGRIVLVNAQTERLFGYSRAELLGQPVEILLPKRFRHVQNYFITPSTLQLDEGLELYGLRKNNTEFPVEVSLSPLETEDGRLVSSAIRDITNQQRLRSRLLAAERQRSADLRRYTSSVQRAQEEERQRIARELHDDLCQRLSGMKLNAEVIADEVRNKDRTLYRRLRSFNKQCEEMIIGVRRMSANLRPVVLDDFGLVVALGLLSREFQTRHKIPIKVETESSARLDLDPQLEIALYRIAQEALSNIAKHAQASRVTVALQKNTEAVLLRIGDNGKGFNPEFVSRKDALHGLGLIGMRERTGLHGGGFAIDSTRKGTTITVTIPLNNGVKHEEDTPSYSR